MSTWTGSEDGQHATGGTGFEASKQPQLEFSLRADLHGERAHLEKSGHMMEKEAQAQTSTNSTLTGDTGTGSITSSWLPL